MTQSFAEDELYIRSRERQNAQKLVRTAFLVKLITDDVYAVLIRLAELEDSNPYAVYGTLAFFAAQNPPGSRWHHSRNVAAIYQHQLERVG